MTAPLAPYLRAPTFDEVRQGLTTDVYFEHTEKILKHRGLDQTRVYAEVTSGEVPGSPWGVFAGASALAALFEGVPVDLYAVPDGTLFSPTDHAGVRVPLAGIEGPYGAWGKLETAALGLVCQPSGIASRTARVRRAAGDLPLMSFGTRRMHPYLCAVIDYYAYIGGCDSVSSVFSARAMGKPASGTMPHALILLVGSDEEAWTFFDKVVEPEVPRIALIDTFKDEKFGALAAAEALGKKLSAVRLDTPDSRRGDFASIVAEVRHALDLAGHEHVKIYVSGGLDEEAVRELRSAGARGFGVGTTIAGAPPIDFSLDIVEVEGKPRVKRGKFGGRKACYRCFDCFLWFAVPQGKSVPGKCARCGGSPELMLKQVVSKGKLLSPAPEADAVRAFVLAQLKRLPEPFGQVRH